MTSILSGCNFQVNARNHARTRYDGDARLTFTYKTDERLAEVRDGELNRSLVTYEYGTANSGTNLLKGKLKATVAHNYAANGQDYQVRKAFDFADPRGRVSAKTLWVNVNAQPTTWSFGETFTWNDLSQLDTLTYPVAGIAPAARIVRHSYAKGGLTSVWEATATGQSLYTYASQIAYHPNGLLQSVLHGNGVSDVQTIVNGMARPASIGTTGALDPQSAIPDWTSGTYQYDGAGNIKLIGTDKYRYDWSSRVLDGCVRGCTAATTQAYTYDAFGNITKITTGGAARTIAASTATNRLTTGATYDAAGNLKTYPSGTTTLAYTWTPHGRMSRFQSTGGSLGGNDREYLYDGDGERVATIDYASGPTARQMTFTLRGLDEKVLREVQISRAWSDPAGTMSVASWSKDTVSGGGRLLATVAPNLGVRHLHLDHLGSVQLMTDTAAFTAGRHVYYPYGQEAPDAANQVQFDTQRMKFTGHERDTQRTLGANWGDDLDYMHARYYGAMVGRFMAVDPLRPVDLQLSDDAEERQRFAEFLRSPGNWNGYGYARDNPIKYLDPDGREPLAATATLWTFMEGGAAGGAAVTAPAWVVPVTAAGTAIYGAYLFGQWAPVSERLTGAFEGLLDLTVYSSGDADRARNRVEQVVQTAQQHMSTYSPPGKDPDKRSRLKNVYEKMKQHLQKARGNLKNLKGKTRIEYERVLRQTEDALERWWMNGA